MHVAKKVGFCSDWPRSGAQLHFSRSRGVVYCNSTNWKLISKRKLTSVLLIVHCRSRRTNLGYPKQSGHQEFREQGNTALISCCNELAAYRRVCDRCCREIWLLVLKCNLYVLVFPCTAFSLISLFVERSWCTFRVSSWSHKPVSKTYRPENWIFDLLITFSSFSVACTSNALIDGAELPFSLGKAL